MHSSKIMQSICQLYKYNSNILCHCQKHVLMIFNLLPVPPLDGSRLLLPFIPNKILARLLPYEHTVRTLLMVLLLLGFMDGIIGSAQNVLANGILNAAIQVVMGIQTIL